MIDSRVAARIVTALRQQLAPMGPAALAALDEPECHAALTVYAEACKAIVTTGNAWNGSSAATQKLIDALHSYLRAHDTITQQARRIQTGARVDRPAELGDDGHKVVRGNRGRKVALASFV